MHYTKCSTFMPITQRNITIAKVYNNRKSSQQFIYRNIKYSQDSSCMTVSCSKLLLHCLLKSAKGVNYQGANQSVEMYCIY